MFPLQRQTLGEISSPASVRRKRNGIAWFFSVDWQTNKWQDKESGQDRYTTEIVANEMKMLGSRGGSGEMSGADTGGSASKAPASRASSPAGNPGSGGDLDLDDDIPC